MRAILEFAAVPLIFTLVGYISYLFGGFTEKNDSLFGLLLSGSIFELYEKPGSISFMYILYGYIYLLVRNSFLFERYSGAYLYNFSFYFISIVMYVFTIVSIILHIMSLEPLFVLGEINTLIFLSLIVISLIKTFFLTHLFPIKLEKNRTIFLFLPFILVLISVFINAVYYGITDYENIDWAQLFILGLFLIVVIKSSYDYLTDKKNKS